MWAPCTGAGQVSGLGKDGSVTPGCSEPMRVPVTWMAFLEFPEGTLGPQIPTFPALCPDLCEPFPSLPQPPPPNLHCLLCKMGAITWRHQVLSEGVEV